MTLLREAIGDSLRRARIAQSRTLREVSTSARVSLGYLSEVERGRKEASSELLAAICEALDVPLSEVLSDVSINMAEQDFAAARTRREPAAAERATASAAPVDAAPAPSPSTFARIPGETRIVIPAPTADKLVLVQAN
ncbi:helix-turn-helix transcriptional regulator [Nocardia sp. CA2R105]|uniref:Helix-turn-helix domain-containing protein n=1 Tax=Nocardia jiangxiensis TaxID=282685 RepID=A0ABW6RTI2_9NOCA|nr:MULTISPECIES: helix-turn-helix transcriptional regulator [Nocardia]MBY8859950.1 helix-turn-helix transcriptional regulator [Nocardia coffeae]